MSRRMCMATRRPKVCYESKEVAEIALEDMQAPGRRHRRGNAGKKPKRIYACGDHWHLTSWSTPEKR